MGRMEVSWTGVALRLPDDANPATPGWRARHGGLHRYLLAASQANCTSGCPLA